MGAVVVVVTTVAGTKRLPMASGVATPKATAAAVVAVVAVATISMSRPSLLSPLWVRAMLLQLGRDLSSAEQDANQAQRVSGIFKAGLVLQDFSDC